MTEILVLYFSRHGSVASLAKTISHGVESIEGCSARVRTVPAVSANTEATEDSIPQSGPPYASASDLEECDGIIIGSPAYFGSMAAPLKYFLDQTTPQWLSGALVNKPAAAFTSSSSFHGGQETALFSILVPCLAAEVVAARTRPDVGAALDEALDAFEREVRRMRDKRSDRRTERAARP